MTAGLLYLVLTSRQCPAHVTTVEAGSITVQLASMLNGVAERRADESVARNAEGSAPPSRVVGNPTGPAAAGLQWKGARHTDRFRLGRGGWFVHVYRLGDRRE